MMTKIKRSDRGFTLIETVITLALYSIVMIMIMGVLLPATKVWLRYSDKEGYASFLSYAKESLIEQLRYAGEVRVVSYTDVSLGDGIITCDSEGNYDIDMYFASAPRKPKKGTKLSIGVVQISDYDLSVKLALTNDDEIVGSIEFPVRVLNMYNTSQPVEFTETVEGKQAICFLP